MDKRFLIGVVKSVDADARTLTAYASTIDLDRDDEVILPSAWADSLEQYKDEGIVLPWAHDYRIPPVGRAIDLEIDKKGLKFRARFAKTDFAEEIWGLYRDKFLDSFSVGFRPRKWEDSDDRGDDNKLPRRTFTDCELLEISCVLVPSNPFALVERGVPVISFKSVADFAMPGEPENKVAIPYTTHRSPPAADEGHAWSAAGARKRVKEWAGGDEWKPAKYKQAFVQLTGEADLITSYKGPHHDVIDGGLKTVWRGVRAAMGSLVFGARGGRIADDAERKGVYRHLAKHYAQWDKEPPTFRDYDEAELKVMFSELYPQVEIKVEHKLLTDEQPDVNVEKPEPTEQPQPDGPPEPEELDAPVDDVSDELLEVISDYLEQVEQQLRDQGVIQ